MERTSNYHVRTTQHESHGTGREPHAYNINNGMGNVPRGCSDCNSKPHVASVSYSRSFETLSSESPRWKHPSCLQGVFDSNVQIANSCSVHSVDPAHSIPITSTDSYMSTLRQPSISTRATEETEITAPSIGARSSLDIEIGSLHSSSSAASEELREFWNEVWSGNEHAFPHA